MRILITFDKEDIHTRQLGKNCEIYVTSALSIVLTPEALTELIEDSKKLVLEKPDG